MTKTKNKRTNRLGARLLTVGLVGVLGTTLIPISQVEAGSFDATEFPNVSVNSTAPNVKLEVIPGTNVGNIKGVKIGQLTSDVTINKNYKLEDNEGEIAIGSGKAISPTGKTYTITGGMSSPGDSEVSTQFEPFASNSADRMFLMFIGSNPGRFNVTAYDNTKFVAAKWMQGKWWYDSNEIFLPFTPNSNDFIVGELRRNSASATTGIHAYVDLFEAGHEVQRDGKTVYKGMGQIFDDKEAKDISSPSAPGGVTATYNADTGGIDFGYGASSDSGDSYIYRSTTNYIPNNYTDRALTTIDGIKVGTGVSSNFGAKINYQGSGVYNDGEVQLYAKSGTTFTVTGPDGKVYTYDPRSGGNREISTSLETDSRPRLLYILFAPTGDLNTRMPMGSGSENPNFRPIFNNANYEEKWRYDDNQKYQPAKLKSTDFIVAQIIRESEDPNVGIHKWEFLKNTTSDPQYKPLVTSAEPKQWSSNLKATVPASGVKGYSYLLSASSTAVPNSTVNTTGTNATLNVSSIGGLKPVQYFSVKTLDNAGNWGGIRTFELKAPQVSASASTTAWTNGNVGVTVNAQNGTYAINKVTRNGTQIRTSGGTFTDTITANGTYTYEVTDTNGFTWKDSVTINNIDKSAPTGNVSQTPTAWTNGSVTLNLNGVADTGGSGIKGIYLPNNTFLASTSGSYTVTSNGTYNFVIEDNAGNKTTKSITVSNIDVTKPTVSFSKTSGGWEKTPHSVSLSATDTGGSNLNRIEYAWSTSASTQPSSWSTYSSAVSQPGVGTHYLWARAIDNAGNVTTSVSGAFQYETTAPTANLSQTPTGWTNGNVTLNLTSVADAGGSGLDTIKLPNGTVVTGTSASQVVTANGTYSFIVTDKAGNSTTKSITVTNIDKTAPTGTLSQTPTAWTNGNVTLNLTGFADGQSGIKEIVLPNNSVVSGQTSASYAVSANGTYSFILRDVAGNSTTKTITVSNIDKTAPTGTLSQTPTSWTNGNVTLNLTSGADSESGIDKIKLPNGSFVSGGTASQVVTSNGTYSFLIYDKAGNVTTRSVTVSNIDKTNPTFNLSASTTAWTKGDVTLNITGVADAGGSGLKNIKLPNGTFVTGTSSSYTVTANGTYSVTAYDNAGNETTKSITVSNIDKTAPGASIAPSTTAPTNKPVSLKATGSDSGSGMSLIELLNGNYTGRNLLENSNREVRGANEFVQFADISPIIKKYGLVPMTISFDIKADVAGSVNVYNQNGSTTEYSIGYNPVNVTTAFKRMSVTVTPSPSTKTDTKSMLAFYGTYGTGRIINVKNVKVELGTNESAYTVAPEDVALSGNVKDYVFTDNGTYQFLFEDKAGNQTTKSYTISNIDKIAPVANISQSPTSWTNGNVTLTLNGITDAGGSGLKSVKMPDGTVVSPVSATSYTHAVSANGTYSFVLEDNAGNQTTKTITVSNIDKSAPSGNVSASTTAWTNNDVVLTLNSIADTGGSGIKEVTLPNGTVISPATAGSYTHVVSSNGTYSFIIKDNAGNSITKTITVNNIDKSTPNGTLSASTTGWTNGNVTLNLTSVSDSGVSGLKNIKLPNGTFVTGTSASYVVSTNGTYTFEIFDNAGNSITKTMTVSNIDKTLPTLTLSYNSSTNVISATASDAGGAGLKEIVKPDGTKVTTSTTTYAPPTFGEYTFVANDHAGNSMSKKILVDRLIAIPDDALRQSILDKISEQFKIKATVSDITEYRLSQLEGDFKAESKGIKNLDGAQYLTSITNMFLEDNAYANLTPLQNLTQLKELHIGKSSVTDISKLSKLTNLEYLDLRYLSISDISTVSQFKKLWYLNVVGTNVSDITPLNELTTLTSFWAHSAKISTLVPLQSNTKLQYLGVEGNQLTSLNGIAGMTQMKELLAERNQLTNISAIKNLTALTKVDLNRNQLSSISDLSNLTNISFLDVSLNRLTDINALANMSKLSFLSIDSNNVSSIEVLRNKASLTGLYAYNNKIWDLTPLANKTIKEFDISSNLVGKLPSNLEGFPDWAYYNNFISGKNNQNVMNVLPNEMMEEEATLDITVDYTKVESDWTSKVTPQVSFTGNSGLSAENVKWNGFRIRSGSPIGTGTATFQLNPDVKRSFQVQVMPVMPTIIVTPSNTQWTNDSVTLDVRASTRVTSVERLFLPNGTNVAGTQTQYVVTKNGVYGFGVMDGYGRMSFTYYEVKNIDKGVPEVNIVSPDEWTNEDPAIQIDVINE